MARKMKDSGIEWIGEIPEEWNANYAFQIFSQVENENAGLKEQNLLSLSYGRIKRKDINTTDGLLPASFEGYNIIDKDDIVLRLTDLQNDQKSLRVGLALERGIITSAYLTLRNRSDVSFASYLYYYLHAFDISKGFYGMGAGVRQSLDWKGLKRLDILIPPLPEQLRIASFLDAKCALIDAAIDKTRASIEEYKKLKQAIITEAVTKGVRGTKRRMKDSGIEWIGEIPEEWEVQRLKWILTERKEKNVPVKTNFILSLGTRFGVIPYSEKEGGGNKAKEDLTDYILAYPNDIVMNSMNIISGSVGISQYFGCVSPVYFIFHGKRNKSISEYYCCLFQTTSFQRSLLGLGNGILMKESSNGTFNTVRMRIPTEKLGNQLLPVPPITEQHDIAKYANDKSSEIDELIRMKDNLIQELIDYKKSIIFEYVTGKKEVPA